MLVECDRFAAAGQYLRQPLLALQKRFIPQIVALQLNHARRRRQASLHALAVQNVGHQSLTVRPAQFCPSGSYFGFAHGRLMTRRSHTGQEIPAGTPAARAFDPCSVAAAPELRPLKRHGTFAPQRQNRLPGRGCCTGLPTNRRRHFRWCLGQVEFATRMGAVLVVRSQLRRRYTAQ